jgi:hypothetical protein
MELMRVRNRRPIGPLVSMFSRREMNSIQFVDDLKEMAGGSRQPVKRSHENDCELPLACIRHQCIQPRTPRFAARYAPVLVLLHDFKSALGGKLSQVVQLGLDMLVGTRNSDIECGSLHLWEFSLSVQKGTGARFPYLNMRLRPAKSEVNWVQPRRTI